MRRELARSERLLLAAILSDDHRAADGDVEVVIGSDLRVTVIRTGPRWSASRMSIREAQAELDRLHALPNPEARPVVAAEVTP